MIKNMIIQNKRGDTSVLILAFGVVAICALVLLSFGISINRAQAHIAGVARVVEANSFSETIKFYKDPKINKDVDLNLYFAKEGEDASKSHYQFLSGTYRVSYDMSRDSSGIYIFTYKEENCGYTGIFGCKDNLIIKKRFVTP